MHRRVNVPSSDEAPPQTPSAEGERRTLADDIRERHHNSMAGGSPLTHEAISFPSLFTRFDFLILIIMCITLFVYVKREYRVDLFWEVWEYVKPDYDPVVQEAIL